MKIVDGLNRLSVISAPSFDTDHTGWCKQLFASLRENGIWGLPRSNLTFQRRGNKLVLIKRGKGHAPMDQQRDYELTQRHFAAAGIEVTDETGGEQT